MSEVDESPVSEPSTATSEISAVQVRERAMPVPQGAAAEDEPPQIPLAPIKRVQAKFNPLADGVIYLVVFLGGFVGTAIRYGLDLALPDAAAQSGLFSAFHIETFIANMIACFIFATLTSYVSQAAWVRKRVRQLTSRGFGMGMCGGLSTLSALAIEELEGMQNGNIAGALLYLFITFACGLVVAWFSTELGLRLASSRSQLLLSSEMTGEQTMRHVTAGETTSLVEDHLKQHIAPPSYEPAPITNEIPLVGDPTTGEVRG